MAATPFEVNVALAKQKFDAYLNSVPTVMATGDQEAADQAEVEMHAHLVEARKVKPRKVKPE